MISPIPLLRAYSSSQACIPCCGLTAVTIEYRHQGEFPINVMIMKRDRHFNILVASHPFYYFRKKDSSRSISRIWEAMMATLS